MKKNSKRPYAYHVVYDPTTGESKVVPAEEVTPDDLFDDCPLCQELKEQAEGGGDGVE